MLFPSLTMTPNELHGLDVAREAVVGALRSARWHAIRGECMPFFA
jgi:hypothetical protein